MPEITYRLKNKILSDEDIVMNRIQVMHYVAGPNYDKDKTIDIFESDREFNDWHKGSNASDMVNRIRDGIRKDKENQFRNHSDLIERYNEEQMRIREEYARLAEKTGYALNSSELFKRATIDRPKDEPAIFHSGILWQHINYYGQYLFVIETLPDFTWFGFNDKCSSLKFIGGGALCEHVWYGGRYFWLLGFLAEIPWIGNDFNDRASSAFLLP